MPLNTPPENVGFRRWRYQGNPISPFILTLFLPKTKEEVKSIQNSIKYLQQSATNREENGPSETFSTSTAPAPAAFITPRECTVHHEVGGPQKSLLHDVHLVIHEAEEQRHPKLHPVLLDLHMLRFRIRNAGLDTEDLPGGSPHPKRAAHHHPFPQGPELPENTFRSRYPELSHS